MDKLKLAQVLVSVGGISLGQLLLKLAAINLDNANAWGIRVGTFCLNAYLLAGLCVLGLSTMLWVWVLRSLSLSIAYPFMALAFVIVPVLSYQVLGEPLGWRNLLGGVLIVSGVAIVST